MPRWTPRACSHWTVAAGARAAPFLGTAAGDVDVFFRLPAGGDQFLPKLGVVLNYSVMNHGKTAVIAGVGVGVGIRGRAMGGPAGVADSGGSGQKLSFLGLLCKAGNSSCDLAQGYLSVVNYRDTGRVITPVFQLPEPFQKDGRCHACSGITNDSAHKMPTVF